MVVHGWMETVTRVILIHMLLQKGVCVCAPARALAQVSQKKMLDAETTSCYSGPVCAIRSKVCHQRQPLPLLCPPSFPSSSPPDVRAGWRSGVALTAAVFVFYKTQSTGLFFLGVNGLK